MVVMVTGLISLLMIFVFFRMAFTLGKIEKNTALMLQEIRFTRHLEETKAGIPPTDG